LNLNRTSLLADLIKDRAKRSDITFDDLMQADLFLHLRNQFHPEDGQFIRWEWFPYTLVYSKYRYETFEVIARAKSRKYFDQMKIGLGISSKEELAKLVEDLRSGEKENPRWSSGRIKIESIINLDEIATIP
jgi:hypothetical protein